MRRGTLTLMILLAMVTLTTTQTNAINLFDELEQRRQAGGGTGYEVYREYSPPPDTDQDGEPDVAQDLWEVNFQKRPGNYLGYVSKAARGMWAKVYTWRDNVDAAPPDKAGAPGYLYRIRPGFQQRDEKGKVVLEGAELLDSTARGMSIGKWVHLDQPGFYIFRGAWHKVGKNEYDISFSDKLEVLDIDPDLLTTPYEQYLVGQSSQRSSTGKVVDADEGEGEPDLGKPSRSSSETASSDKPARQLATGGNAQSDPSAVREPGKQKPKRKTAKADQPTHQALFVQAKVLPKNEKLTVTVLESDGQPFNGDLDFKAGIDMISIKAGALNGAKLVKGSFSLTTTGWKELVVEVPIGFSFVTGQAEGTIVIQKGR